MSLLKSNEYKNLLRVVNSLYLTVITDEKGIVVYISDDYIKVLNIEDDVVIGRHIAEIIPNTKIPEVIRSKKETIGDIFTLQNGEIVICNRTLIRDESNKIVGLISTATFQDIFKVVELNKKIDALIKENKIYKEEIKKIKNTQNKLDKIVGTSKVISDLKERMLKISTSPISILITGETGTGKEVFANAIHKLSDRCNNNFVKINCAAIPKELIESELFGYAPGSFSGGIKIW